MADVYFDTSALVKLLVEEDGSHVVDELWHRCEEAFASRLAYPEMRAALAALHRGRHLGQGALARAESGWEDRWAAIGPVELTAEIGRRAGLLAKAHALRGADAVHLASALSLRSDEVVVAVWDRRLHDGARAAGLRVVPASLDG